VVMDINMPHLNGIEATRKILKESPLWKALCRRNARSRRCRLLAQGERPGGVDHGN
jgi:CheY-like chemotaxis protein